MPKSADSDSLTGPAHNESFQYGLHPLTSRKRGVVILVLGVSDCLYPGKTRFSLNQLMANCSPTFGSRSTRFTSRKRGVYGFCILRYNPKTGGLWIRMPRYNPKTGSVESLFTSLLR